MFLNRLPRVPSKRAANFFWPYFYYEDKEILFPIWKIKLLCLFQNFLGSSVSTNFSLRLVYHELKQLFLNAKCLHLVRQNMITGGPHYLGSCICNCDYSLAVKEGTTTNNRGNNKLFSNCVFWYMSQELKFWYWGPSLTLFLHDPWIFLWSWRIKRSF